LERGQIGLAFWSSRRYRVQRFGEYAALLHVFEPPEHGRTNSLYRDIAAGLESLDHLVDFFRLHEADGYRVNEACG